MSFCVDALISPAGGSFSAPVTVTLSSATSGATIRYTTDGSAPSASSTVYSAPFQVASSATLRAIAMKTGLNDSAISTATFTIGSSIRLTSRFQLRPPPKQYPLARPLVTRSRFHRSTDFGKRKPGCKGFARWCVIILIAPSVAGSGTF